RVDYAYYMKGLVNFEKQPNAIERLFHVDLSKRPPTTANKSFAAFRTVVQESPKSAYVGAVRRAKLVLDNYEGAPATRDALAIMIVCYDRLGLKANADESRKVYAANFTGQVAQVAAAEQRHWWQVF